MKLEYELSELSKQDLEDIWIFTVKKWSIDQANMYYELIFKEVNLICINPIIEKSIHTVKENHSIKQVQSHMIMYKEIKNRIWIDRILLNRMDIKTRLKE